MLHAYRLTLMRALCVLCDRSTPLIKYIDGIDRSDDRPVTVVLASFVPHNWWEWLLHSQNAIRLKASLLFRPNTIVIDVPYHIDDGHRSRL